MIGRFRLGRAATVTTALVGGVLCACGCAPRGRLCPPATRGIDCPSPTGGSVSARGPTVRGGGAPLDSGGASTLGASLRGEHEALAVCEARVRELEAQLGRLERRRYRGAETGEVAAETLAFQSVLALRAALAKHQVPPARAKDNHALSDAWNSIMKPRVSQMLGIVDGWKDARRWEFVDDDDQPDRWRPNFWSGAVAAASRLYAALGGSLEQYGRVSIVWTKQGTFGFTALPAANVERETLGEAEASARRAAEEAARAARMLRAKEIVAAIQAGLDAKRTELAENAVALRTLMATLQRAEERRLWDMVDRLADRAEDRAQAESLLAAMRVGRVNAENFSGKSAAGYGSILQQQWLHARTDLVRLLEGADVVTPAVVDRRRGEPEGPPPAEGRGAEEGSKDEKPDETESPAPGR